MNFLLAFYQNHKINKILKDKFLIKLFILAIFVILIIIISILRNNYYVEGETYRLLTFPVLLLSLSVLEFDYNKVLKFGLVLCVFALSYMTIESLIINAYFWTNSSFNFHTHPLAKALLGNYSSFNLDYFQLRNDYGFKYWRPFGIAGDPHKSAMTFPLGIIILLFIKSKKENVLKKKTMLLTMIAFLLGAFLSGAKTALFLASLFFLNDLIIKYKYIFITVSLILLVYFLHRWYGNIYPSLSDFYSFFKQKINIILIGIGFIKLSLLKEQFALYNESFLARILFQIGIIPILITIGLFLKTIIIPYINKFDFMVIVFLFFSIYHYPLTSEYFIMLLLSLVIIKNHKYKTNLNIAAV